MSCLRRIDRRDITDDRHGPAVSSPVSPTVRESQRLVIRLASVAGTSWTVGPGEQLTLGRDPSHSSARALSSFDNVSRSHATIGIEVDGAAWVRDDGSANGTYVNGESVAAGGRVPIAPGLPLRLASDVNLSIERADASRGGQL